MRHKPTPEELIINELDATNQSTTDIIAILNQTKELGTDTLIKLDEQGRQIGTVQNDVDQLLAQQETTKRHLRSISSIFWDIINYFRNDPVPPNHNQQVSELLAKEQAKKKKAASSCCVPRQKKKKSLPVDDVIGGGLKTKDSKNKYDESEKMLDEAGRLVGDLKEIATDMGREIKTHNTQLDVLKGASSESRLSMEDAEGRIKILLNKTSS